MWQAAGVDPVAHRHKLVCVGNTDFKFYGCMLIGLGKKNDFLINRFLKCGRFKIDS